MNKNNLMKILMLTAAVSTSAMAAEFGEKLASVPTPQQPAEFGVTLGQFGRQQEAFGEQLKAEFTKLGTALQSEDRWSRHKDDMGVENSRSDEQQHTDVASGASSFVQQHTGAPPQLPQPPVVQATDVASDAPAPLTRDQSQKVYNDALAEAQKFKGDLEASSAAALIFDELREAGLANEFTFNLNLNRRFYDKRSQKYLDLAELKKAYAFLSQKKAEHHL